MEAKEEARNFSLNREMPFILFRLMRSAIQQLDAESRC